MALVVLRCGRGKYYRRGYAIQTGGSRASNTGRDARILALPGVRGSRVPGRRGRSYAWSFEVNYKQGTIPMASTPYEDARRSVEARGPADQLRLIAELTSRLSGKVESKSRSLMELEGLGQEAWHGVDVDEYLRRERTSWSG